MIPRKQWSNRIHGTVIADEVSIGVGVTIEEGVEIKAGKIVIGDHVYIGRNTRIFVPEIRIGDYTRINAETFAGGTKPMMIGRNVYIGGKCRMDSRGGLTIQDNVGIGDHSQLWSHILHGDLVEGCRFNEERPLTIGRDVWLVGHCLVSPVTIADKSMAMLGSVITKDMAYNRVYGGVPAKDITDKTGPQFVERSVDEKFSALRLLIADFERQYPQYAGHLKACKTAEDFVRDCTCFEVMERTYTKLGSEAEVLFLKTGKAKFTPNSEWESIRMAESFRQSMRFEVFP